MVGLGEAFWQKSPFELSGGQKRRVAIAGVLAMRPEVLILDEPTAGLDPAGRDDLFHQIQLLHKQSGMTIVLVSHSMDDVARYTEQVIVLDHGELRMSGTPEEIFKRYLELEEMGLGAPQMTYLIHELKDVGIRFKDRPDTVDEMCDAIVDLWKRYTKSLAGKQPVKTAQDSRTAADGSPAQDVQIKPAAAAPQGSREEAGKEDGVC